MRKLADLYFNYDVKSREYLVASYENMKEEDRQLVEDLMRDARLKVQLNNACRSLRGKDRIDRDLEVANFDVNINSSVSSASNVKLIVTLLKVDDESDLRVSLFSLVAGPTM